MSQPFYAEGGYVCRVIGQALTMTSNGNVQFELSFTVLGPPDPVHFLLGFMALDYFTGLIAGALRKEISSGRAWRGLGKKVLTLLLLTALYLAEREAGFGLQITTMAALAYVVNEAISILENCARAGVPIPPKLIAFLLAVQKLRGANTERFRE